MNPIVKLAASALPGEKKYVLLAGAGVSKDSGIPTSWDLMMKTAGLLYAAENNGESDRSVDLPKWFNESRYANLPYSELIDQIYPKYPDQQCFLKKYLADFKTGTAHILVAELARRGIIRAIITTNFDHFIEKALEEKGLEPQVISREEDLRHSEPLIHCKAIRVYKPHGTLGHGPLKNTPKDLERLSKAMEEELIRVMGEHGVIVLGYAGQDGSILHVLEKRSSNYYPLFWIDPAMPRGKAKKIIERQQYTYIKCRGAGQFIQDYLKMIDRLDVLAPQTGRGPTIPDLKQAVAEAQQPTGPIFRDFLSNLIPDMETTRPDFSQFPEYDEAIAQQIVNLLPFTLRFIEASLIASKANDADALRELYQFFGNILKLYNIPEGFSGSYRPEDFDGFRFAGYEMFVSLIASMLRYEHWELLDDLLNEDLFLDKKYESKYETFCHVSSDARSLDEVRNKRLGLNRISVMADMIKERFTNTELSEELTHKEFLEADYFLFMRTVCHVKDLKYLYDVWNPRASVWLDHVPVFIVKSQSIRFLKRMLPATGCDSTAEFIANLKEKHGAFERYFGRGFITDPLQRFDLDQLGARK